MTTYRSFTVAADEAQLMARLVIQREAQAGGLLEEQLRMAQEVADASQARLDGVERASGGSASDRVADRARARLARWSERQAARIADGTLQVHRSDPDGTIKVHPDVTTGQEIAS